ncbi:MAG: sensor histidine kinase [Acidimicrobiales bacterium]
MTFRTRMVLAAVVVAVFAILAASLGAYLASRNALINSVDDVLHSTVDQVLQFSDSPSGISIDPSDGRVLDVASPIAQLEAAGVRSSQPTLPVTAGVRAVAAGRAKAFYTDIRVGGVEYREYVAPTPPIRVNNGAFVFLTSGSVQVAQVLTGVNDQLGHLGFALLVVALAALSLAVLLGWFVSRTAVNPLNDLTASIEELARTTDVSERLEPGGPDELGRLRHAFNHLLGALEASRESQQQLVVDASHELRTPLTSLRTNLEIVRRVDELPEAEREVLVADVLSQMEELTNLVGDLAELARGNRTDEQAAPLRLDQLVDDAVQLANTHGRQRAVTFLPELDETWVEGRADRIARAVGNLLDNALKWSPDGGTVNVRCRGGDVAVRDHGPGIDTEDLPHIFDRFYRSRAARALPGSGLGLAIVAQVADDEGGSVAASNARDGGAVITLHLPVVREPAEVP